MKMKRIAVMFGLGIAVSMSVRAASCGVHDENRRIADAKLENFANSLTNAVKAFEAGNAVIAVAESFERADRIETLARFVDIATSTNAEPMRIEEYMDWHRIIDVAANRVARSRDPQDVLVKWRILLKRYKVMKADLGKHEKIADPFDDGTCARLVGELDKRWGSRSRRCAEYHEELGKIFQQCRGIERNRHYGVTLAFDLRDEVRDYYDTYKCFLHRDYRKMSPGAAEREILIKEVEEVLGRKPKWFPQIEDLTPEDAIARMAYDLERDFTVAQYESTAFGRMLGSVSDAKRRGELVAKAAETFLEKGFEGERIPSGGEVSARANCIGVLARILLDDKRTLSAWRLLVRLLTGMKRTLGRYEAANVSILTAEGSVPVSEMKAHGVGELRKWLACYKNPPNDSETQGLNALETQLKILCFENQYFDGEHCMLKGSLAMMSPEDRGELLKEVEAVLGRPPKWASAERQEAK